MMVNLRQWCLTTERKDQEFADQIRRNGNAKLVNSEKAVKRLRKVGFNKQI